MTNIKNEIDAFQDFALFHSISDFYDLTLAELIALEFLSRYKDPVIRYALYTEVNQYLEYLEEDPNFKDYIRIEDYQKRFYNFVDIDNNPISTSTFYNNLSNLEKAGLIDFNYNDAGKVNVVLPTQFTRYVPKLLLKFIINNSIMNTQGIRMETIDKVLEKLGQLHFKSVLTVWFTEKIIFSFIQSIKPFTDNIFMLAKNETNEDIKKMKLQNVEYSKILNGMIREPDNIFDLSVIPIHKKKPKFYDMTSKEILNEIYRVTKPGGYIVLVGMEDVPLTNNIYADDLLKIYKSAVINRIFNKKEIKAELDGLGLIEIITINFDGLMIGFGKKKRSKYHLKW